MERENPNFTQERSSPCFTWLRNQNTHSAKVLSRNDGSLTGNPNEILEMLTDHIGEIYTTHANVDEEALYRSFFGKYQHEIEDLRQITEVPDFSAFELCFFPNKARIQIRRVG